MVDAIRRVAVEAPAKINLHLDITGLRADGYHLLDTVMQAVSLCDLVVVSRAATAGIRITCSRPGIPEDGRNLAHKAAMAFAEATGLVLPGLHIHIDKAIPHEAGLGGGSADAAAVLVALNLLLGAELPNEKLRQLGLTLGADVPFAIWGGCALCRGVGEEITPLAPLSPCHIVIAKPAAGMGTREAYTRYDTRGDIRHQGSGTLCAAIRNGDPAASAGAMFNVFEQVDGVSTATIKEVMTAHGALGCALSGSGSAVASIFGSRAQAEACRSALSHRAEEVFLCAPVAHGAKVIYKS